MRPLGIPPPPRARSRVIDPVEMNCADMFADLSVFPDGKRSPRARLVSISGKEKPFMASLHLQRFCHHLTLAKGCCQSLARLERRRGEEIDRKSTRLNSSHQIISYAVFCLKKKKITKHYNT